MHKYIIPIARAFKSRANAKNAKGAAAYMLNQFEFFGLKTPERRALCKAHFRNYPINDYETLEAVVRECFTLPEREFQYFAIELSGHFKALWPQSAIKLMEECLVTKSWWDSVDHITGYWLDPYFRKYPARIIPVTGRWNRSDNIWLQRASIMFQKTFKKETDEALLSKYILHCKDSKEFFVRKAIGWALREYSKTAPQWVTAFVTKNSLSPLSAREAMKRLDAAKEKSRRD